MKQLYTYFRSSAAYRVRIALNLKQLAYDSIPVHLVKDGGEQFSEDYVARNPQKLVPTYEEKGLTLTQSLAIIEYLDEVYPTPALLPETPADKAFVRSLAYITACDIHPLDNLRVLKYLRGPMACSEEQKQAWYQHWIIEGFTALEAMITARDPKAVFCFGDSPTLADLCLIPQMYNAKRFDCPLEAFPTLVRIDEHCQMIDAFKAAAPEAQADAAC